MCEHRVLARLMSPLPELLEQSHAVNAHSSEGVSKSQHSDMNVWKSSAFEWETLVYVI